MQSISGFIDYDNNGKPFMGIIVEDGGIMLHIFLARKDDAQMRAQRIANELHKLAKDLISTPDKLVEVHGDINAIVRNPPGSTGQRSR